MPSALATAILLLAALLQQSHASPAAKPQFTITGTVVNALEGTPIPNAEVSIAGVNIEGQEQAVLSGDDGSFSFVVSIPGKYSLTAGHKGFAKQAYLQHDNFASAIVVGANLDSANIVFRIFPDASISGEITDEQGDPVRGSQVILFSQNISNGKKEIDQNNQASTDDEGRYHFAHLPLGTYYLAIAAQPWYAQNALQPQSGVVNSGQRSTADDQRTSLDVAYPVTFYPDATDSSEAEAIALKPGDKFQADIHLSPVPAVHVRFSDPKAASTSGFRGFAMAASETIFGTYKINVPYTMSSSTDGTQELSGLPPGTYDLRYFQVRGKETSSRTDTVNLSDGMKLDLDEAPTGSRISGVVRVEGAADLPGSVTVMLRNVNTPEIAGTQVTPDGKFIFEHDVLTAGRYQVMSNSAQLLALRSMSATGARVSGEYLDVDGTNDVHLALALAHFVPTVDGVALRDGKPVPGAMIVLVPQNSADHQSMFRRDETDSDGSFSLAAVVPGKYTAIAIDDGWNLEWANPSILAKYLPGGTTVDVETEGKYNLRVKIQQP